MIERINEKNIWDFLKADGKPVVLYGMGLGAEKIMDTLSLYGIAVSDIFASDEFVRGHSFRGFKVLKYKEICEKYDDFNVVLCFASRLDNVIDNIRRINLEHSVFAPDVPVAGGGLFNREFVKEHDADFDFVYDNLEDEESKRIYLDIINYKVSGRLSYLLNSFADKDRIYSDILKLTSQESILDLGAYDGDTIAEFLNATKGKYRDITALEPDKKSFKKLEKNTEGLDNITLLNKGVWNKCDTLIFSDRAGRNSRLSVEGSGVEVITIDSLNKPFTFIKMDIEGSEMRALEGGEKTIKKHRPKLYICAYHRNEDLFALPRKVLELNPDYKMFFRHSKYIPAWESNFYFVNEE
ncbi:MAG: FkbM family methyltransferase [Eubacterium sp.]|nr:FkbM family methyltransferase [Eubacterium sp.]